MDDLKNAEKAQPQDVIIDERRGLLAPDTIDRSRFQKGKKTKRKRKNKGRGEKPFYIALCSIGAFVLVLVVLSIFSSKTTEARANPNASAEPSPVASASADPANMISTGIINDYGDEIVIPDIYEGLALSEFDMDSFTVTSNGFLSYNDYPTYVGIDVSEHQMEIDWEAVKASGVDFAMIRVGYRGYTAGTISEDLYFRQNVEGALAVGIKVGIYFFSQAINVEEAVEEARFVIDMIEQYDITYPVAFDWEEVLSEDARTSEITQDELTQCTIAFCEAIADAGYYPLIYFNQMAGYTHFRLTDLNQWDFWLAEYNETPNFIFNFHMWQYSSTGEVDGISVPVDLNISFVDYSAE